MPLILFVAVSAAPYYSARLDLILHGVPFAKVVPKENLDIFKFVEGLDDMACRAIVFSGGRAIGWIFLPVTGGFPSFIPFVGKPNLEINAIPSFQFVLTMLWAYRSIILAIQGIFFLFWMRKRELPLGAKMAAAA